MLGISTLRKFQVFIPSPTPLPSPQPSISSSPTPSPSVSPVPTISFAPTPLPGAVVRRSRSLLSFGTAIWTVSFQTSSDAQDQQAVLANITSQLSSSAYSDSVSLVLNVTSVSASDIQAVLNTRHPTHLPTLAPTTWMPTSVPTIHCDLGYYLDTTTTTYSCVACVVGKYANQDTAPFATSCSLCPAGQFQTQAASSSCSQCDVGKVCSCFCSSSSPPSSS
jgi:hypothetical protein